MTRQPKGSVVVQVYRGRLRLQLPRSLGTSRHLYLGLPDTPTNRQSAQARANQISSDIAFDRFDYSLERYKVAAIAADSNPPLRDLWEKYTHYKAQRLSQSTLEKDFKRISNHIDALPTQRLRDARKIRKHLADTLTPSAANKSLMYLTACCDWAVEEELIQVNPFKNLGRLASGKKTKAINPFTKVEVDLILAAFEQHPHYSHYTAFVEFLFFTGCRTSEAIGLQWRHISPDLKTITFSEALVLGNRKGTKTGTARRFPVNRQLRSLLSRIQNPNAKPSDLVFPSPTGLPIDSHNFLNRAWKKVLAETGVSYRPQYNTRHTFITLCLDAGVPVQQVANWVGNSPRTIWQHYAGLISTKAVPVFE